MKIKLLFSVLAISFLSIISFAQEKNIGIEISLKDSKILTTDKNVPVKIKITNKSERELKTNDLGNLFLYFSKCRIDEICFNRQGDLLFGIIELKSKSLKKNKSIEFERNLSDLIWIDELSSYHYNKKNFETIPSENIYFYAAIPTRKNVLPEGVRLPKDFLSNQIKVSLNSK